MLANGDASRQQSAVADRGGATRVSCTAPRSGSIRSAEQKGLAFLVAEARASYNVDAGRARAAEPLGNLAAEGASIAALACRSCRPARVMLPPLRARGDDIPPLIERYWRAVDTDERQRRCSRALSPAALTALPNALLARQSRPSCRASSQNLQCCCAARSPPDHVKRLLGEVGVAESGAWRPRSPRGFSSCRCARRARRSSASTSSNCSGREQSNMSKVAEKAGLERTHLYRKLKQLNIRFSRRADDSATMACSRRSAASSSDLTRPPRRRDAASVWRRSSSARSASSTATSARARCTRCALRSPGPHGSPLTPRQRARRAVGDLLGADHRRHAQVHHADHARRQPRRGRHPRADARSCRAARATRARRAGGSSASASSARRCSTATA